MVIESNIDGMKETSVIEGKGYYKKENNEIVVYFISDDIKYKYVYENDKLNIYCNDSSYEFKEGKYCEAKIKNGDYVFLITTFATKIEIKDNLIVVNYILSQKDNVFGKYNSQLSFH